MVTFATMTGMARQPSYRISLAAFKEDVPMNHKPGLDLVSIDVSLLDLIAGGDGESEEEGETETEAEEEL